MKAIKALICAILFTAVSLFADGTNKIESAFGIKLGDKIDMSKIIDKGQTTDGEPMLQFKPENPHEYFHNYYVLVTPKTQRIYCIWAIGSEMETDKAKVQQEVVFAALTKKYGPEDEKPLLSFNDAKRIRQGDREVYVNVAGLVQGSLNLRYTDTSLEKLARKERIEEEASKKDNSGL